jgi:hypothetical protein
MIKSDTELVYKEQITHLLLLLLEIAGNDAEGSEDFEEAYRKRLKFQKQTDWKRFRACIDLLDDTEYAIMSAFEYQLGDLSIDNRDTGETNLRLYGIVNAVYLQMNAFIQIANLLHYPNPRMIDEIFQQLDIYKLRGIAGSHTVDYIYDKQTLQSKPGITKTTSFRIVQFHLEKTGSKITVLDENNITFEFNLLKVLTEYEKNATDLLVKLILHSIKVLVHKKADKVEIKKRLDEMLPNLIDYSKIDKNKEYKINRKGNSKNGKQL